MIAVAVVAIGIGSETMQRRRVRYLRMAGDHASKEVNSESMERTIRDWACEWDQRAQNMRETLELAQRSNTFDLGENIASYSEREKRARDRAARLWGDWTRYFKYSSHHAAMKQKYQHAARYPWLPIAPDPPPPE